LVVSRRPLRVPSRSTAVSTTILDWVCAVHGGEEELHQMHQTTPTALDESVAWPERFQAGSGCLNVKLTAKCQGARNSSRGCSHRRKCETRIRGVGSEES